MKVPAVEDKLQIVYVPVNQLKPYKGNPRKINEKGIAKLQRSVEEFGFVSGAYAARHAAKNLVAAGLASRCEVQIAYAIGVAHPVAVAVDTFGTGLVPDDALAVIARQVFDFRPAAIIDRLGLARSLYRQTAAYGHFGKPNLPWEAVDAVPELLSRA